MLMIAPPPRSPQVRDSELGHQELALEVDADDPVPGGFVHVLGGHVGSGGLDTGVVDQDVQAAEFRDGFFDHALGVGDVNSRRR